MSLQDGADQTRVSGAAPGAAGQAGAQPVRFGIVVFPGSNCDTDAQRAVLSFPGTEARFLWHKDTDLKGADCLIVPGGFSYGDYLRSGAMAACSPISLSLWSISSFVFSTTSSILPGCILPS